MQRAIVEVGRKRIGCLVAEPPPGVPPHRVRTALFLHAFPLHGSMWTPTLGALPDGWRAIAPDYRGFGQSPIPDGGGPATMGDFAGDVVDLLDRLAIADAAVIGCSMGGYVLFELLRSAPRYVSAVGLVSTRPGADTEEGRRNRQKMIDLVMRDGVEAVAADMVPKLLGETTRRDRPDLDGQVRNLIVENSREGVRAAVEAMMTRPDSSPVLGRIDVPALVVHGAGDKLIPPAEAEQMRSAIKNARLELVPSSGHLPNLEQPARFDRILADFLSTL